MGTSCCKEVQVSSNNTTRLIADGDNAITWKQGDLIGQGEFGRVFLAMNLDSSELIAVKTISLSRDRESSAKIISQIRKEVNILKKLTHRNIVKYYQTDIDLDTNSLHILFEFIPRGNLQKIIEQFHPLSEKMIAKYTKEILTGLDFLHKNGIIHRDLKSANILVADDSSIKLSDFGLSKSVDTKKYSNDIAGSPYWMAPELFNNENYSFSADIWSLGCTIIEMMTGRPPWFNKCKTVEQLVKCLKNPNVNVEIPKCSEELSNFLNKCFERNPSTRISAENLLQHEFLKINFSSTGNTSISSS